MQKENCKISFQFDRQDFSLVSRYEMHDKLDASNGLNDDVKNLDSLAKRYYRETQTNRVATGSREMKLYSEIIHGK